MSTPDLQVATDGVRSMASSMSASGDEIGGAARPSGVDAGRSSGGLEDSIAALMSGLDELAGALSALGSKTSEQADRYDRLDASMATAMIVRSERISDE